MAVASRSLDAGELRANLARMLAIFNRDRLMETSYLPMFILSWANIVVEVAVAFFISWLLHPSAQFGWNGHVGTYFEYLVVKAREWEAQHPDGAYPKGTPRLKIGATWPELAQ